MKKEKEFYTSPEVNVFTLQSEGVICQSLQYGSAGEPGAGFDFNDYGSDF